MDRAGAVAEGAGVTAGEGGLHLGEDREGDFGGALGAEVEADGGVEPGELGGSRGGAGAGEVGEDAVGAFFGPEQAEVGEVKREQVAQQGHVVHVVVRHYDREGAGLRGDPRDELGRGRDDETVGGGEADRGREGGAGIGDGDVPTKLVRERGQRLGVVAGTEYQERGRRVDCLKEPSGVDRCGTGRELGAEAGAEREGRRGVAPNDGERGGPAGGEIRGEQGDPGRRGERYGFEQDLDDAVTTEADAPDQVVLRRGIVGDEFGPAGGGDALGAGEDIFFEATAADGAEAFAGGGDEKPSAGPTVGRARDGDEGGEDRVGWAGTRPGERSKLGRKIVHRVGNNRAEGAGKRPAQTDHFGNPQRGEEGSAGKRVFR